MSRPPSMKRGASDDFQTPSYALRPLLPHLRKDWLIWECAAGDGQLVSALRRSGYIVEGTDIADNPPKDFLSTWDTGAFADMADCIITNPPYSLKHEFMKRCIELRKPFALLLPLTFLATYKRQKLLAQANVQIIFMGGRINFETPSGEGSGSWFETAWFTSGLISHNIYPDSPINRTPL